MPRLTFGKWDIDFNADFYQGKNRNEQIVLNNGETDATWTDRRDRFEQDGFSADADDHIQQTITSAFADYSLELGAFSLQAGLRYEYQKTHYYEAGIFQPSQSPDYHHVLPMASVSYRKGDWNAGLSFKLNKFSPSYSMLSSAVSYVNKYQYSNGNPHLVPPWNKPGNGGTHWLKHNVPHGYLLRSVI